MVNMFLKHSSAPSSGVQANWKVQSELLSLFADLLSARCTVDRLRFLGTAAVAQSVDPQKLEEMRTNLKIVAEFVAALEQQFGPAKPSRAHGGTQQ